MRQRELGAGNELYRLNLDDFHGGFLYLLGRAFSATSSSSSSSSSSSLLLVLLSSSSALTFVSSASVQQQQVNVGDSSGTGRALASPRWRCLASMRGLGRRFLVEDHSSYRGRGILFVAAHDRAAIAYIPRLLATLWRFDACACSHDQLDYICRLQRPALASFSPPSLGKCIFK